MPSAADRAEARYQAEVERRRRKAEEDEEKRRRALRGGREAHEAHKLEVGARAKARAGAVQERRKPAYTNGRTLARGRRAAPRAASAASASSRRTRDNPAPAPPRAAPRGIPAQRRPPAGKRPRVGKDGRKLGGGRWGKAPAGRGIKGGGAGRQDHGFRVPPGWATDPRIADMDPGQREAYYKFLRDETRRRGGGPVSIKAKVKRPPTGRPPGARVPPACLTPRPSSAQSGSRPALLPAKPSAWQKSENTRKP